MATYAQLEEGFNKAYEMGDKDTARILGEAIVRARKDPSNLIPGNEIPWTKEKDESSLIDKVKGVGDAALTAGTAATSGLVGQIGGFVGGLAGAIQQGEFGTQEGANRIQKITSQTAAKYTRAPKTEEGGEILQGMGNALSRYVTPVAPMTGELNALASGAKQAANRLYVPKGKGQPSSVVRAAQRRAIQESDDVGVNVMTSDIRQPKTFVGRWAQSTGEKIPLAGTGGMRKAQQSQRIGAVRGILKDYGADEAANFAEVIMRDLSKKRGDALTRFTDMKSSVINRLGKGGVVPVNKTVAAIDDQISNLKALKTKEVAPVIAKLEDWKSSVQGQNLQNLEALRKQIGESFVGQELASVRSIGEKAASRIYGPLREDMGAFIKSSGGKGDYQKWAIANKQLSELSGELSNSALKSVLKKGDATPEVVNRMLFSKKPSEIKALYSNLSPDGRANARAAILSRAAEKAGGIDNISPERFVSEVTRLGESVGVFFQKQDLNRINGLVRVLKLTKRASQADVSPPTGVQVAIPVGAAVLTDLLGGPGSSIAAGATIGLLARLYESPAVRNLLIRLPKTAKGSAAEAAVVQQIITEMAKEAAK